MLEKSVKDMYFIFLELVVATVLLTLITQIGGLGTKMERNNEIIIQKQEYLKELSLLHEIADPLITFTGSEVAEIISTNGEKFSYSIKIGAQEHIIERDSTEYEKAKEVAKLRLDTGKYTKQFAKDGDKLYYIDTELWSPEYITSNIMGEQVYGTYTAKLLLQDPLDSTKWLDKKADGTDFTAEDVRGKIYRIQYIWKG